MRKDISKKLFWQFIVSLIIIRVFMVVLLMFNVSIVPFKDHFPMLHTGDDSVYFKVSKSFSEFDFVDHKPGYYTVGLPVVYAPYFWVFSPENLRELAKPVFLIQAFILYSISIVLVVIIANRLLRSRKSGVVAGIIYVFYPGLIYVLNVGPYSINYSAFADSMWLRPVMSDAPSAFFIYLGVALSLVAIRKNSKNKIILSAIASGFASLVRITNILICAALGLWYLYQKEYKKFLLFFLVALFVYSFQFAFNIYNQGNPVNFGQYNEDVVAANVEHHYNTKEPGRIDVPRVLAPINYLYALTVFDKYIPGLAFVMSLIIALFVLTIRYFYKINKSSAVFVFFWLLFFIAFYGTMPPAARQIRYWLPIIPALIVLFIVFNKMVIDHTKKMYYLIKKQIS